MKQSLYALLIGMMSVVIIGYDVRRRQTSANSWAARGSAAQTHGAILLAVRMLTVRMLMDGNRRLCEKV